MGVFAQPDGPKREALKRLSEGLLQRSGRIGVRGNLLEVRHPAAPVFDPTFLHSASEAFGLSLSLSQDGRAGHGQRVCCDPAQLPFQDGVFSMVLLHHEQGNVAAGELVDVLPFDAWL